MLKTNSMYFGGDYNPEQWPESVWEEDIALMNKLGVNLVSLGIFSWSAIEVEEGRFDFGWMDKIVKLLTEAGIAIDMASGTASPPAWLTKKHPEMLATTDTGTRFAHGGRQHYSPASKAYEEYSLKYLEEILKRYAGHPNIVMWHVSNEIGCHNPYDFGQEAAVKFREWLRTKYATIDDLNAAWYTTFWSQRFTDFEEINTPSFTSYGTSPNPAMQMDFRRYSSDQLLSIFTRERDLIRKYDDSTPITTNFMSMSGISAMNYWQWSKEVDFVSTDHYLTFASDDRDIDLALYSDLTRGFAGGDNWLLMEHSSSSVNWQPVNSIKTKHEALNNGLQHVFRGSQGALFFQFRQSRGGSERFHSSMIPHSGSESRIFRNMKLLSEHLDSLSDITEAETDKADIAFIFDYEDSWVTDQNNIPSEKLNYREELHQWYKAFFKLDQRVDFIDKSQTHKKFTDYKILVAPMMHITEEWLVDQLKAFVEDGGTLITTYFSGAADRNLELQGSSYGGKFLTDIFGVRVEEYAPMREQQGSLSNGFSNSLWREIVQTQEDVETLATYESQDETEGNSAITLRALGNGRSIYVGTRLVNQDLMKLMTQTLGIEDGDNGINTVKRGNKKLVWNGAKQSLSLHGLNLEPGECSIEES